MSKTQFRTVTNDKRFFLSELVILLFFCLLPFALYSWVFAKGNVLVSTDGLGFYRLRELHKMILADGELPLWNKYLINGTPYAEDLNLVFYPFFWVTVWLPIRIQIYVFYALHITLGSFFFYKYLVEMDVKKLIAFLTAFMYAISIHLNGYRKSHIMIIIVIVWLPVILYFIQKYLNTLKKQYLLCSSFALAISFLGGFPQDELYIDLIAVLYLSVFLVKKSGVKQAFRDVMLWGLSFCGLIAVQLIPTAYLLRTYSAAGANEMTYAEFANFSIAPIKLLMMLFPNMFHPNLFNALGKTNSSEIDTEIYLGVIVVVVLLYGVIKFWKNRYVRFGAIAIAVSFVYASCTHYPFIGKVIYHLPLFGNFRCPSRALFVFLFFIYVVFAISIQQITEQEELHGFLRYIGIGAMLFWTTFLALFLLLRLKEGINAEIALILYHIRNDAIWAGTQLSVLWLGVFIEEKMQVRLLIPMASTVLCALAVLPYSIVSASTPFAKIYEEDQKDFYEQMASEIGTCKAMVANSGISGEYDSFFSVEKGIHYRIPAMNAYISINNPKLYRILSPSGQIGARQNFSGLFTGFEEVERDVSLNNDLISMLGIKYIVDPEGIITPDGTAVDNIEAKNCILSEANLTIQNKLGETYVAQYPVEIKEDSYYICRLQAYNNDSETVNIYLDLYGGELYDRADQQKNLQLRPGDNTFEFFISSGEIPVDDVRARLVTGDVCNLSNVTMEIYETKSNELAAYKPYNIDSSIQVWENVNAKEVLFGVEHVEQVDSFTDIYDNIEKYDFLNTAYIEEEPTGTIAPIFIDNIVWKNNSAEADVTCEGELGFVNFSNNYYPGWRAYVDGERVDLYEVNGIIQGAYVSGGTHHIRFVYVPIILYVSALISFLTLVLDIAILMISVNKQKKGVATE